MNQNSFNKLFYRRELSEIRGQNNRNYTILISILMGTFIAITIADGGLDYLRLKMNDPFVKNLDVKIPWDKTGRVRTYKYVLNQDSLKQRFHYDTVMSHAIMPLQFWNQHFSDYTMEKGRSIEYRNPILDQIMAKSNLVHGRYFSDEFDHGLIVTRKLLVDHGYPLDAHFIDMGLPRSPEGFYKVPIPIIAVVEELPGLASFAFTPYFYSTRTQSTNNPFRIDKYPLIEFFMPGENVEDLEQVKSVLRKIVEQHESFVNLDPYVETSSYNFSYEPGNLISISFYPIPESLEELNALYEQLIETETLKSLKKDLTRCHYFEMPSFPEMEPAYDYISLMFSSLRHVGAFNEYLFDLFELEVEMSKIRDKDNFVAISFLTISMAVILLIFSVFSVAIFVFNLLRNHLLKIRMNLGTFKAFGMSNNEIKLIYRGIIRRFCLASIGISLGIVFILDVFMVLIFLQDLSVWHMANIYTLAAILAILISVEWTVKRTSNSILEHTPGDLIYGRDNN